MPRAGQGFASIYLSTLPHTSIDGVFYVWSWIATVQLLSALTQTVLEVKVRSSALVFVFRVSTRLRPSFKLTRYV